MREARLTRSTGATDIPRNHARVQSRELINARFKKFEDLRGGVVVDRCRWFHVRPARYSIRNAAVGSIRLAPRPGTMDAARATIPREGRDTMNVTTSRASVRQKR